MTYKFHVIVEKGPTEWQARCPTFTHLGAATGGQTREEALTHIHTILVMILRDYIAKGRDIPADTYDSNAITIEVE